MVTVEFQPKSAGGASQTIHSDSASRRDICQNKNMCVGNGIAKQNFTLINLMKQDMCTLTLPCTGAGDKKI